MKKLLLLITIVLSSVFFSCKKEDGGNGTSPSTYPQLSGAYRGSTALFSYRWEFDNTNKAHQTVWTWNSVLQRWDHLDGGDYEWKVAGGTFYEKLWNNNYDTFDNHTFEFVDANNFKLDGVAYQRE